MSSNSMWRMISFCLLLYAQAAFAQVPMTGAGLGSSGWTPQTPPGLIAWYKADNDGTNLFSDSACTVPQTTNAGSVACWKDKSGHGYNATTTTNLPTYLLAGLNGLPTVNFVTTSTQRLITASGVAMGTGNAISGFAEMSVAGSLNFGEAFVYGPPAATSSASGGTFFAITPSSTEFIEGGKGNVAAGSVAIVYGTPARMGYVNDGTNGTTYVNNSGGTPTANTNASISGGCIGIGSGVSSCATFGTGLSGTISEIVIYNQALSSANRSALDSYLAARW